MPETITKNGVRAWQAVSTFAVMVAAAAVIWNYSELWAMNSTLAELRGAQSTCVALPAQIADLFRIIAKGDIEAAALKANQLEVMRRLNELERSNK